MNKNMTAMVSCFARSYHTKNSIVKIYNDELAGRLLSQKEYDDIAANMAGGISFFNPGYSGDNPLEWIVNNQLAPSVLARSAFNERHLNNEIRLGLCQYVIMAAGYDTSGYRVNDKVKVFELDMPEMIEDKIMRVDAAEIDSSNVSYIGCDFNSGWIDKLLDTDFDEESKTYCSLMGISYYLNKKTFGDTVRILAEHMPEGSCIAFDYPDISRSRNKEINKELARAADEKMQAEYSLGDIEAIADNAGLLIYENSDCSQLDDMYFTNYNLMNRDHEITAPQGICCCLRVKKQPG